MLRWTLPILFLAILTASLSADDLSVLTADKASPPKAMLKRYLRGQVEESLEKRRVTYEGLKTKQQLTDYQQRLRKSFLEQLALPERTPLNAKVVSAIEGDRYRVERILFESQPRHFVSAMLFLPTAAKPPFPVVVMPCGHSAIGKVANQTAGIFLASQGIACLAYDPIGQGERNQFLDGDGKPLFRSSTMEHTIVGAGSIPLGRGTATYRIWDGMRAIDYVASRKDIDAKRIGVSGCSGGGTLTSYLMALDDRVACAAPSCYLTSFRRLLDTIGPQDAEQNIHGQLAFGMDHADYMTMRAPKPTLILAATQDFFDISGTWDSYRQAKRFYTRLGFPERVSLVETDTKHGYPREQREAMVRWMKRWLVGKDEHVTEPEISARPSDDYRCSPKGQVMLLDKARSVVDLNVELNASLEPRRRELWKDEKAALAEVRKLAGIRPFDKLPEAKKTDAGQIERKGYTIDKFSLQSEAGIALPSLLFRPTKTSGKRYLYLHGDGKHVDAKEGGPIEKLVLAGNIVLAVDLRGIGETGPDQGGQWGGNSGDFFVSYLLGRSVVGMRAEDALVAARFLAGHNKVKPGGKVSLIAVGAAGPAALHAAALESATFDEVKLVRCLPSWSDVVKYPASPGQLMNTVHGALRAYDLPDLVAAVGKERVTVEEPLKLGPPVKK